jgi:outer membrane protein TolC
VKGSVAHGILLLGVLAGLWLTRTAKAQTAVAPPDTSILDFETYMARVLSDHPLSLAADLQPEMGTAALRSARGAFDPKAIADYNTKDDNDLEYYNRFSGGLKIPTWFGLELMAGYDRNQGAFLNPENNTSTSGLWLAGASLTLGQGLFLDERRAALRQAQLFQEATLAERLLQLNDLLYEAGSAYWDWFKAYHALGVYDSAVFLAEQRYDAVRMAAFLGDRPNIDTLEAGIQVQLRRISLEQARLDLANASALLGVYLWEDGFVPLEPGPGTIPPALRALGSLPVQDVLYAALDSLINQHPLLVQTRIKLSQLDIERRWKAEQLKPQVDLKYYAINTPVSGEDPWTDYSTENYQFGVAFSMPLFLRKERGALRLTKLKMEQTELELNAKQAALAFKAQAMLNTWSTTAGLSEQFEQTVRDLGGLLNGERRLFEGGESSLFLINAREMAYVNAQVQFIDLVVRNRKAGLAARYAFGGLGR